MYLADYLEFVGPEEIRVKGHRVGLEHLIQYYHNGYSAEEIAFEFPGLALEQVYGILAYYLRHQSEVDLYIRRQNERGENEYQAAMERPSPPMARIRALLSQRLSA